MNASSCTRRLHESASICVKLASCNCPEHHKCTDRDFAALRVRHLPKPAEIETRWQLVHRAAISHGFGIEQGRPQLLVRSATASLARRARYTGQSKPLVQRHCLGGAGCARSWRTCAESLRLGRITMTPELSPKSCDAKANAGVGASARLSIFRTALQSLSSQAATS